MAQYGSSSKSFWLSASIFILFLGLVFVIIGITYIILLKKNFFKGSFHTGTAMIIVGILLIMFSIPILISVVRNRNRVPVHLNPAYSIRPSSKTTVEEPTPITKSASVKRSSTKRPQVNQNPVATSLNDNLQSIHGHVRSQEHQNNHRHRPQIHAQQRSLEEQDSEVTHPDWKKAPSHSTKSHVANNPVIITFENQSSEDIDFEPIDRSKYFDSPSAPFIPYPSKNTYHVQNEILVPIDYHQENNRVIHTYVPPDQIPAEFMSETQELSHNNPPSRSNSKRKRAQDEIRREL